MMNRYMEVQLTTEDTMNSVYTRSHLESLTTGDLVHLADHWGIDIPPDLERVFIIRELLENLEEGPVPESPLAGKNSIHPAPLPKQYNITFLEVLVRDPLWVYVFWEIKGHDREKYTANPDFGGYFLKVTELENASSGGEPRPLDPAGGSDSSRSFTVDVGEEDTAWYLGFAPGGGSFRVELCARLMGMKSQRGQQVLAVSRSFILPALLESVSLPGENPLWALSGIEYFPVLRKTDRLSRIR